MTQNAYSFLPWLRTGIATKIAGDPGTADRASIPVKLRLTADGGANSREVEQTVQIYGPGDVIGVESRAIVRTEPRPWITNVEPNYLPHIEFYDEDFPWRYSPAAPDPETGRLRPWLALVVLAGPPDLPNDGEPPGDAECTQGTVPGRPLPHVTVLDPATSLPPPDQLGAWAHVHVNGWLDDDSVVSDDTDELVAAITRLRDVLRENPDNACARIICPRRLDPDTGYHGFLVPAFETGRLAGLKQDPSASPGALYPSWGGGDPAYQPKEPGRLPYYHRWFFTTGSAGDFEELVRLLRPREPDARVGRRDLDAHAPSHPKLPGITTPTQPSGVLRLGGALRVPGQQGDAFEKWDEPGYPQPFQQAMAAFINLADDYGSQGVAAANAAFAGGDPTDEDPIITPPLYGRWHALTNRLLVGAEGDPITPNRNWVHKLNLDPRYRVAANFGTEVIQRRQEEFMAAAWAQIGDVLNANARIRAAQLAIEVGQVLRAKHLEMRAGATDEEAPVSGRPLVLTAPAHSRVTRGAVAVGFHVAESRVAAAPVSPAMRRITRPGSRLVKELFEGQPLDRLLPRMDDPADPVTAAPPKTTPDVVTPATLDEYLRQQDPGPGGLADPVDELPLSPDFRVSVPEEGFVAHEGTQDSDEAGLFKLALRDLHRGFGDAAAGGQVTSRPALDVDATSNSVLTGLHPDQTVPRNLLSDVKLPARLQPFADQFIEAMAYPVIDLPMYEALLEMSVERFIPNLNLIPPNTVTLLETNQPFIESYLIGLNHEMARELLWREYPTDQRGTPFRQFWDVHTVLSPPEETAEQRRERLYDIKPIHKWTKESELGKNDNRESGDDQEEDLVLVIRGELLKKYPTAVIYAQKAAWTLTNGVPDPDLERTPAGEIKMPLYNARVDPDIYLLGFDLTEDEARGEPAPADPGWFFVIKERPGDPRFGADVSKAVNVEVWNDLSWADVDPGGTGFIKLDPAVSVDLVPLEAVDPDPTDDQEKQEQHLEDVALPRWHAKLSSADLAYMLFQVPVLMAVHAQEMLPDERP